MDQGIIQTTKLKSCKKQLLYMIREMEKNKELCGSDILKKILILDAIYWVAKSWEEVEKSTIVKCFRKSVSQGLMKEYSAEMEMILI
jgi:hypothetical protein